MSSKSERLFNQNSRAVHSEAVERKLREAKGSTGERMAAIAILVISPVTVTSSAINIYEHYSVVFEEEQQATAYAQEARDVYENASVAIIPYNLHIHPAEQVGITIEETFNALNEGIISIDVDVIRPTLETVQTYSEINADGCIDKNDLSNYGSYIAEQEMPELKEYDKILAINMNPSCQQAIAGVAMGEGVSGRYSEIFGGIGSWIDATAQADDRQGLEGIFDHLMTPYIGFGAATGVHELYHLFGLGHAGVLKTPADFRGKVMTLKSGSETPKRIDYDVPAAVEQKEYHEYGDRSVMGNGLVEPGDELSVIEQFLLDWPNRQLGNDTAVNIQNVHDGAIEFTPDTIGDSLAIYNFGSGINLKGFDHTYTFDRVVFIPTLDTTGSKKGGINGVDVLLLDELNNTAHLDTMLNALEQNMTYNLDFYGDTIRVELDYDANKIRIEMTEVE